MAVALSGSGWWRVFDGDEATALRDLDTFLSELEPGVITTWNGARFDLPFISDRAGSLGVDLGLKLQPDAFFRSRHEPLPGHCGGYVARWFDHSHLDAYQVYRADVGAVMGIPCSLKTLARFVGLEPVEVDRERIHDLSVQELHDYVASDAIITRDLALRRWRTAQHHIDCLT